MCSRFPAIDRQPESERTLWWRRGGVKRGRGHGETSTFNRPDGGLLSPRIGAYLGIFKIMSSVEQALDQDRQHHMAGRLAEAKDIYQRILQADPE